MSKNSSKNFLLLLSIVVFILAASAAIFLDRQGGGGLFSSSQEKVSNIQLSIVSPISGSKVGLPEVTVTGITVPEAVVSCNEAETVADLEGNYAMKVSLVEGENTLVVIASDKNNESVQKEIIVNFESFK